MKWCALLLLLAACDESTSGGDRTATLDGAPDDAAPSDEAGRAPEGDATTNTSFAPEATHYAQAFCTQLSKCNATALAGIYGDLAGCEARSVEAALWVVSLPGSGFTPSALGACADASAAADCASFLSQATVFSACFPKGTRALGQSCLDGTQCASGFCPSAGYACARCADPPAAGASCANGVCAAGMVCASSGTCAVVAKSGAACGSSKPCDSFLECKMGTCQPVPATAGAACGSATANAYCDERVPLACTSATSGTCASLAFGDKGAACGLAAGVVHACKASGACVSGVCQAGPGAGQACGASGPFCQFPDQCVNGRCVAPPPASACP
jgi:hypothetical protein